MSYIDDNLMNGEQVVYRAKLHWMVFQWTIFFFIITIFVMLLSGSGEATAGFFLITAVIGLGNFITYKTSEFGITNKRVLVKVGFISRNTLETLLTSV